MYVYNDITTDARVQRAANALANDFDLTLVSTQKGKKIEDREYKNILVGGHSKGVKNIFATILATWRIIRNQRPDIVYCHDYYSAILAYVLICTRYSGKIVYDAHELMIPEKGRNDYRLKFFYWFEKRIVKNVDLLVCASEQRGEIMRKHYGLNTTPYVVPNISQLKINDNDADTANILTLLNDFFKYQALTIVYAGVVVSNRRINELFDAVMTLSDRCKLLIVGDGNALANLKRRSEEHPELAVAFTGKVPYKCLGSILSRCDIGFLYYPVDTLNNKFCASNKVYEYTSVGLPIISNNNPTIIDEIEKNGIGIASNDFIEAINTMIPRIGFYRTACENFSVKNRWDVFSERLCARIDQL